MSKAGVAGFVLLLSALSVGCAARVIGGPSDGSDDGGSGGDGGPNGGGDAAPDVVYRDVPVVFDVFREDACPGDGGGRVEMFDCDPLRSSQTCTEPGQGCYPFVEYPMGTCGTEVYGARCIPAGTLPMNAFCASDQGDYCAPGLTCFVTGSGNRCLALCDLTGGTMQCPHGQVCEPTDNPHIGACD